MRIEKAGPDDFEELTRVWESSVRATHDFLREEDIRSIGAGMKTRYLPAVALHCVRQEGRIAAFIGLENRHIAMLFVRAECRGRGYGRTLVRWALDTHSARTVDVNEQNGQAVGFYRHMGFVEIGRSETDDEGRPFPILHLRSEP